MKNLNNPVFSFRKSLLSFLLILFTSAITLAQQNSLTDKNASAEKDSVVRPAVLITAYGLQKKSEITGSVSTINSEGFNKGYISDPLQLIQGKVSGLDISKAGGNPNGKFYLRLRGLNTLSANDQPLIIIDGSIDASLETVDPNDIESFTVLKDGSAAAMYGVRGSNGAILVTTKKGKQGAPAVNYNVCTNVEMVAKNTPMMNSAEWRQLNTALGGQGIDYGTSTDWQKEIEQTALSQVHNLSISGGNDKTSYRASLNFRQGNGVEIETGYTQLNGRISLSQKALNDKLTLDVNLGATERKSQYGFPEAFRYASIFNPTAPVMSNDPAYDKYDHYFNLILFDYYNPVQILKQNLNEGNDHLLNASLKGTYQITKGLAADAFYSTQTINNFSGLYYAKHSYFVGIDRNGLASRSTDNSSNQLFEATAHWIGDIANDINLTALGGYSYQNYINQGFYAQGGNFLTDAFTYNNLAAAKDFADGKGNISSYKNSNKLIAFFGRLNLNVKNTYYLTASARYEGSSRFGANKKWGLYPALGAGIQLGKLLNIPFINNLKLRADYGITGNQPTESYLSLLKFGPSWDYINGTSQRTYSPISNYNPNLKGERKIEFDFGLDFTLFRSKLSGSIDLYTNTSKDLLYLFSVPVPPNLYNTQWLNIGKLKNSGLEVTVNYNVIKKSGFSYTISLTGSHVSRSDLASLSATYNGTTLSFGTMDLGDIGSPGMCCVPLIRTEEGKPIGQILSLVYNGIDQNGNMIIVDQNNDGSIDQRDRIVVGNGTPDLMAGIDNIFTYKNWDMDVFFRGVTGHDLVNSYRAFYEVPNYIRYYNLPETALDMKNAISGVYLKNYSGMFSTKEVENASFISLDYISLGYSFRLPEGSQFRKIRMYLGGNNLFYLTGYKGSDPNPRYIDNENLGTLGNPLVPGIDRRNTWPRTRSFTFGANVSFQP